MIAALIALLFALVPAPALHNALAVAIPACPTEDSVGCYWDADVRGNMLGRSFVAIPDGTVIYLDGGEPTDPNGWD